MADKKAKDQLSELQLCTLIALWTRPPGMVARTDLTKDHLNLDSGTRKVLEKAGLIEVRQERKNGPVFLRLTNDGRDRVNKHIDAEPLPGTRCGPATLRLVLARLRPLLDRSAGLPPAPAAAVAVDMESRIRKAYAAIAPRPGAWVMLSRLRDALGPADRAEVDTALRRLNREPDVQIVPESNQKVLTPEERAAAVSVGNQDRHAVSIGS